MIKKITSYILVLLLIILLTSSIAIIIFSQTIFKQDFTIKMLEKENYYTKLYAQIIEKFKDNTIQSGLDDEVLNGIITEEQVEEDIKSLIAGIYNKSEYTINTEKVKERLNENIKKVIEKNKKDISNQEQQAIDIYVTTIGDIYSREIAYAQNYIPKVQEVFSKTQNIMQKVGVLLYISFGVIFALIIIINKKESIKYLSITAMSTGILLIIPTIMEKNIINTQNILLFNQTFSKVVVNIVETIMLKFLIFGIVFLVIGIALNVVSSRKFNITKQ